MSSFSDDGEEYRFFDAYENSGLSSDESPGRRDSNSGADNNVVSTDIQYNIWVGSPRSIRERRRNFFRWMDYSSDEAPGEGSENVCRDGEASKEKDDSGRIVEASCSDRAMESSGAVLRSAGFEEEFLSSRLSVSSSSRELDSCTASGCGSRNPGGGNGCNVNEDGKEAKLSVVACESFSGMFTPRRLQYEARGTRARMLEKVKRRFLSRMRSITCVAIGPREDNTRTSGLDSVHGSRAWRTKVRHCKKRLKELSGLLVGQDFQAHAGSILAMKFSHDGQYLATAGEDKIVKIWQVVEAERSSKIDFPDLDPSCIYFTVNHLSELAPLAAEEKARQLKNMRKTADSACIILPSKIFRIIETPMHVFRAHSGDILDLSWSQNNCLLSSSVDKTVRLWKVGCSECLNVFRHSNYVTCVQFNPVNDDSFISGSIDGKVRIWAVSDCKVVDWIDIKDIVTAVSYRPDGQGGIVGSIAGVCRFFDLSGNRLQVEAKVCLHIKKKSPGKRITGFQFFPQDPSKVMVTCADSQVRILSGCNVITKYKGPRSAANYTSASLTSNGKYIVSASKDCNVYLWNCNGVEESLLPQSKSVRSFECFSTDASIAIPWRGFSGSKSGNQLDVHNNLTNIFPLSSAMYFSLANNICVESIPKGSATWPEEKLPLPSPRPLSSEICRSQYKFLKTSCHNLSATHAWGMVIVTAGWDGRIRSFHNYGLPVPN